MDEQISRNILENFEVPTVENQQHEIHKLNGTGVLKAMENGSLQFITVPTRDSEFIDHSLLNPEYITTHLANGGFIIDLMENQDTNQDHNQTTQQYINESIGNELQFHSNDDHERRLTATLFQLVKGNVRVNNETQVIVTNKDGELNGQQLLQIDDPDTLTHTLLNEGQFKIFPSSAISLNGGGTTNQVQLNNQQLPQLTPIRRLNRQRKNSINNNHNVVESVNMNVQNLKINDELLDQNSYPRLLAKKVLPHKKRITKKLKAIDKIETQINLQQQKQQSLSEQNHQQQQHIDFYENSDVVRQDESIILNTSKFSCQICGLGFETQLEFFSHLKGHYEPIKTDENESKIIIKDVHGGVSKVEPTFESVDLPDVALQFHNFSNHDVTLDQQHSNSSHHSTQFHENHEFTNHQTNHIHCNEQQSEDHRHEFHSKLNDLPTQVLNLENKIFDTCNNNMTQTLITTTQSTHNQIQNLTTTTTTQANTTNKGILLIQDELEFSDTEDMLEGIRGVVDKVQESVDDTGDEMDIISPNRLTWYSNSALNGEINFKQPRIQNINSNIDSYQIFFKNDLDQKNGNDNCTNNGDDVENRIAQHVLQLQQQQQQHQQESSNNLMTAVIVDHTQDGTATTSVSDIPIIDNSNSVMTTLHIPYQNDFNITIKSEDISIDDTQYSPPPEISTITKKPKKIKKSDKEKKIKKTSIEKSTNIKDNKFNNSPINNNNIPIESKRSRGRPPKTKTIINENDIKIEEIIKEIPLNDDANDDNDDDAEIDSDYCDDTDDDDDDDDNDDNIDLDDSNMEKTNRKKYICQKCDKVFNSINALKYHDFSHTGERPHQCDICGKSFFALNALRAHLRVHSGEKPFNCDDCGRAFRQWGDLTYHKISLHSNEKNFQCEFCGKAFARKYSLVIHRRIHTQERNYKCEFCPKTFRASSYLQNHRKIHTGEKPYICSTCSKKFRVCGDLKRHQKIHEREKKLTNHLEEIIKTEKPPINKTEVDIIKNNKFTSNVTTFLIETETNSNTNCTTNLITSIEPIELSKLLNTTATKECTQKTNKKNRKTNSKKK